MKIMMNLFNKLKLNPNNINLYEEAFTHTSYTNENPYSTNYERLEFLGDAVLELITSDYLYNARHLEEGKMTKIRASYVCENACATYAKDLGFDKEIRLGSGEPYPNDTILADVFEAFIGATYLDKGFEYTKELTLNIIVKYINNKIEFLQDYKSRLQELVQTVKQSVIYEIIDEQGPAHNKIFTCQVKVDNIVMGEGKGHSKKQAEQEAAKIALSKQAKKI
jgi:ribonuclease-3